MFTTLQQEAKDVNLRGNSLRGKSGKGLLSLLLVPNNKSNRKVEGVCAAAAAAGEDSSQNHGTMNAPVSGPANRHAMQSLPQSKATASPIWLGFSRDFGARWTLGPEIGKGGNGVVRHCVERPVRESTKSSYACKCVPKVPKDPQKASKHLENLRREIGVLGRLQGSLNIIKLEAVFEDEDNVYVIIENCKGGELAAAVGQRHYSERTAASYMRAVLRTLAQCHANNVLHRDVKPGNFMLLSEDERAPVKAIDFGLAIPFERDDLPLTDLGLEGTPWFMAPEALASQYFPASDVWSAGVMAHQMLCGRLPFDDKHNPSRPSLSAVWRSVLNDPLELNKPWWDGISAEGKDFVHKLLHRDYRKRPTAKEALKHPWLKGDSSQRSVGKQLQQSVVARIQRFGAKSALKRSVLQMIAAELLTRPHLALPPQPQKNGQDPSVATASSPAQAALVIPGPSAPALKELLHVLHLDDGHTRVDAAQVSQALNALGLKLDDSEVERLFSRLDISNSGQVPRSMMAASQVDWRHLQQSHKDTWLELARAAFTSLDTDSDGVLRIDEIISRLSHSLPEAEVRAAVEHALEEAGQVGETQGLVFSDFLRMLKCGSEDSLDIYDQRRGSLGGGSSSIDRLNQMLHASVSASSLGDYSRHGALGQDSSNHSSALLSPARTMDHTNNSRLFQLDQSVHEPNTSNSRGVGMRRADSSNLNSNRGVDAAPSAGGITGTPAVPDCSSYGNHVATFSSSSAPGGMPVPATGSIAAAAAAAAAGASSSQTASDGLGWRFGGEAVPSAGSGQPVLKASQATGWVGSAPTARTAPPSSIWRFDNPQPSPQRVSEKKGEREEVNMKDKEAVAPSVGLSAGAQLPDGRHHGSSLYVNQIAKCRPIGKSRSSSARFLAVRE